MPRAVHDSGGKAMDGERERMREALTRIEARARDALADWLAGGPSGAHEALQAIREMAKAAGGGGWQLGYASVSLPFTTFRFLETPTEGGVVMGSPGLRSA